MTPDKFTNQEFHLDVGDGHNLYVQDWGRADVAVPALFIVGGPGGAVKDRQRQYFDPEHERVIFYDQRGCGQSTPYGSRQHNTTTDLVEDIVKIMQHLHLEQVILVGGSWGSTLACAFGIAHPKQVKAMVLNGIFTAAKDETDWLDEGGFQMFYPEAWEAYVASVPSKHRKDPSSYHFPRALGDDEAAAKESAYTYATLEGSVMRLDDRSQPEDFEDFDPAPIQLELHYISNGCFMPDNHIFDNAGKLTMPIWLVQGRYDMVCPPITAYKLSQQLSNSHLMMATSNHAPGRESWSVIRTILIQMFAS